MRSISDYGWNAFFAASWDSGDYVGCVPGRVVADFGSVLRVFTPDVQTAVISGKLRATKDTSLLPKVGDWVALQVPTSGHAQIMAVLPRNTEIVRKVAGTGTDRHVLATNVDVALLVQAMDEDFSIGRLERYMYQLSQVNIQPIVVLNKSDKASDYTQYVDQLKDIDAEVVIMSARYDEGIQPILQIMKPAMTYVLLGSSGVGKSTITNKLLGEAVQKTQEVREDDSSGRHTTVHRELFLLSNGSLLIDTPGNREVQLWGTEEALDDTYEDIAELISQCRFNNCSHTKEPGCAIRQALDDQRLTPQRYAQYQKMKQELHELRTKSDPYGKKEREKYISRKIKEITKDDDQY